MLFLFLVIYLLIYLYSYFSIRHLSLFYKSRNKQGNKENCSVSLIKPVKGDDEFSKDCFLSWIDQSYDAPIEFLFSFQDKNDPAIDLLKEIISKRKDKDIKYIVNDIREGFSAKSSNLFYGVEQASYQLIIMSDADTLAPKNTIKEIVELTEKDNIVSALVVHTKGKNAWGRIYAAVWNYALACVWAPRVLKGSPDGVSGGTVSLYRENLDRVGGVEAFKDYIAEDLALGKKCIAKSIRITLGPKIYSPVGFMMLSELVNKLTRSSLVGIVTVGVLGFLFLNFLFHGHVILLLDGDFSLFISFFYFIRFVFFKMLELTLLSSSLRLKDIVVLDFIALFCAFKSLVYKKVSWGGVSYKVLKDGKIERKL